MKRAILLGLALTALVGCGGGGGGADAPTPVTTGGNGQVANVRLGPPSGTAFVAQGVTFQMGWTPAAPPPPLVELSLNRYQEARGGAERLVKLQRIDVTPAAGALTWDIRPRSSLAGDGVYFLELTTSGQGTVRGCYLVESGRAVPKTRAITINAGTSSGSLTGVQFSPAPGSVYISRASSFRIAWPAGGTPPPTFEIRLWRYKEARNALGREVTEQALADPVRDGSSFAWTLRRRDGADLDSGGVYYLELRAPGETDARAAYIVSAEL